MSSGVVEVKLTSAIQYGNVNNGSVAPFTNMDRGVARRRPLGPGLNLKMLKKMITIHKPRSFLQEIPYCHVEHCHFKSLLLASPRSPDTKFTYLCLHMQSSLMLSNTFASDSTTKMLKASKMNRFY